MRKHICFLSCLAVLVSMSALADTTVSQYVSTSDFFRQFDFRSAAISPNGQLVSAIENPDGRVDQLVIKQVDDGAGGAVFLADEKGSSIGHPHWISDDTLVFYVYDKDKNAALYSAHWLGLQDGKPRVQLGEDWGGYKAELVDPLMNQGSHALISIYNVNTDHSEVYNIDFSDLHDQLTPQHRVASIEGYAFMWLSSQGGEVGMAGTYGKDGEKDYWTLRPETGHWFQFKAVKPSDVFYPVSYAPNGHDLIVETKIGHDTLELWTYDPAHDKFLDKLYANPDFDIDDVLYDWFDYRVTGVTWYQGSVQHYQMFDANLAARQKELERLYPDHVVNILDGSRDGKRVMAFVSDAQDPGTYYVYDADQRKSFQIGKRMPWIPDGTLVKIQSNMVKSVDGLNVEYLVAVPLVNKPPYPVVVIPHGGPLGIMDTLSYNSEVQMIANRGYAVIQVNYRGSGGNGKKFYDAGKGEWGKKIEDDIETAVRAALTRYPLDPDRICIYGESYGGYSAIMSTIRDPGLYKCAASFAGVMDVPLLYETSDWSTSPYMRQLMTDITGNPDTQFDQLYDVSPVYNVNKLTRPVFIAQGVQDERVDQEQAYRMRATLEKLGKPYKFQIYEYEGHGFSYLDDTVDFYEKLVEFMDDSLNPKKPAGDDHKHDRR